MRIKLSVLASDDFLDAATNQFFEPLRKKLASRSNVKKLATSPHNPNATTLYRGYGNENPNSPILWYSTTRDIAEGYMRQRTGAKLDIISVDLTKLTTTSMSHGNYVIKPALFIQRIMKDAGVPPRDFKLHKDYAFEYMHYLEDRFGKGRVQVIDLWSDQDSQMRLAQFLKHFGVDAIHILEQKESTYAFVNV